jgi:23S rRNA U2552 (ribose-2'-O)-methylase RlmE/FtsJ
MSYINLPSLNNNDLELNIVFNDNNDDNNFISHSLNNYLSKIKEQINNYNENWDYHKKITNPYEFIHTHIPGTNYSVSKYKPLSRSFFKMIEIIKVFNFLNNKENIKTFHLAEGPGGFIEAFTYIRNNNNDIYYAITLISDNINIPSWKKSKTFLNNNKNVIIETGKSKTGDLLLKENLLYIKNTYKNSMDFITGDGGIDFSCDFNNQEHLSLKLVFAQIVYALVLQNKGGNFILKIFDIFKLFSVELVFILCNMYENIYIYKPFTSRIANSEKYIICKGFKNNNNQFINSLVLNFDKIIKNIQNIKSIFNINIPNVFKNKLEEINAIYGQQQIENINSTLNLIREYLNQKNDNIITLNHLSLNEVSLNEVSLNFDKNNVSPKSEVLSSGNLSERNSFNLDDSIENNIDYIKDFSINELRIFNDKHICLDNNSIKKEKYNQKIEILKNINLQKAISWCNKYNFPINKNLE